MGQHDVEAGAFNLIKKKRKNPKKGTCIMVEFQLLTPIDRVSPIFLEWRIGHNIGLQASISIRSPVSMGTKSTLNGMCAWWGGAEKTVRKP